MTTTITLPTSAALVTKAEVKAGLFVTSDGELALRLSQSRQGMFDYVTLTGDKRYTWEEVSDGTGRRPDVLPILSASTEVSIGGLEWHSGEDISAGAIFIDKDGAHLVCKSNGGQSSLCQIGTGDIRWPDDYTRGMVAEKWTLIIKQGGEVVARVDGGALVAA